MTTAQADLFAPPAPKLPEGFRYQPELIDEAQEAQLLAGLEALDFRPFEFQGYLGKRRVVSFGWRYDFTDRSLRPAEPVPPFLQPLQAQAAAFAGLEAEDLRHLLITEYGPGAPIGWHRDRPEFDQVVGVSLLSPALFRLRRRRGSGWERASLVVAPRSAYLLSGPARTDWEHSIPPAETLRYSLTFRSLRSG